MKVTVRERKEKLVEIEVSLPFYRYHDASGDGYASDYWTKVYQGAGCAVELTLHQVMRFGEIEWGCLYRPFRPGCDTADYVLGRGEYALTGEQWEETRQTFLAWLREHEILGAGA